MKTIRWMLTIVAIALPAIVAAQSATTGAIAGVVKDATGAVLPGVTVEASSPALIEKTRAVVTDGEGNYRIVDLRPGTYTVTFTLPGFSVVKRDGLTLTTGFTASVNADLKVGELSETVTVTGASPVVDVQNTRVQTVLSSELLDSAPAGRKDLFAYAALTVGVRSNGGGAQDVGGDRGAGGAPAYHGINGADAKYKIDGMDYNSINGVGGGNTNFYHPNDLTYSEINLGLGSAGAENETGGVQINHVPREGGNRFSATGKVSFANDKFATTNLSDDLRARGLTSVGGIKRMWDYGIGLGGPIVKDRLWFFTGGRVWGSRIGIPGAFFNATQHTPFYTPDLNRPVIAEIWDHDLPVRLTWQVSRNNKVTFSHNESRSCLCHFAAAPTLAPEANPTYFTVARVSQATWTHPQGNRLLFQGGLGYNDMGLSTIYTGDVVPTDIATVDVGTGMLYRASSGTSFASTTGTLYGDNNESDPLVGRFSVSYVTGSHALKVGLTTMDGRQNWHMRINQSLQYVFLNRQPISLTQFATPIDEQLHVQSRGFYAQDQWTMKKLTLNVGARLDMFKGWVNAKDIPAGPFVPQRSFGRVDNVPNFKDISPRVGVAYDLFGNGKTALKGNLGRYPVSLGIGIAEQNNPALRIVTATSRTWTDADGNYSPNCVLTNFAANGECGAIANNLFGTVVPGTNFSDDVLGGWGTRGYSWQTAASVQQELRPGLSATIGYYHNWYGNMLANINQAVTAADFSSYCVTAPSDARLPGGGGNQICGNYDVNPAKFGQVRTLIDRASNLGVDLSRVYNGAEVSFTGRFGQGAQLSGGVNIGRTVTDDCGLNSIPQAFATGNSFIENTQDSTLGGGVHPRLDAYCHVAPPWSQAYSVKLNGVYPLPYGFEVGSVFQLYPGLMGLANLTYTNAQVAPALGRNLASGPAGTVVIPIAPPQTVFEHRLTQLDIRLSKKLKFGGARVKGNVDIYNLTNSNTITRLNPTYGALWLAPLQIMGARYMRIGAQVDF